MAIPTGLVALIAVWLASTAYVLAQIPVIPFMTNDTPHYVGFALTRPPAYGWLLAAFRSAGGGPDYAYLPQLQTLLIAFALLAFAWQLAALLRAPLIVAAIIPIIWMNRGMYEAARFVMAEGLFLPALLAGLACAAAHARNGGALSLAGTTFFCALATLSRTAGAALLLVPLLLVLLDTGAGLRLTLRRLALVVMVAALPLLAGMTWQHVRNGEFTLGSFAGQSLAGKAMLLLRPELADDPVLARMAPLAEQARAAVAAAPDYAASLRAQAQAYTDLRFRGLWPAAAAGGAGWSKTDVAVQVLGSPPAGESPHLRPGHGGRQPGRPAGHGCASGALRHACATRPGAACGAAHAGDGGGDAGDAGRNRAVRGRAIPLYDRLPYHARGPAGLAGCAGAEA
jgi:hypothetical protein